MYYAHLAGGLRGCYADNNGGPIKFKTRKELRAAVAGEAHSWRDAGYTGASEKAISAMVQEYWTRIGGNRGGKPPRPWSPYQTVLSLKGRGSRYSAFGVFLSPMDRDEYRAAIKELD